LLNSTPDVFISLGPTQQELRKRSGWNLLPSR
jgi:hypothetical protein